MSHIADGPSETAPPSTAGEPTHVRPRWWHRGHPASTTLLGFFVGLAFALAVPGIVAAIIGVVADGAPTRQVVPFLGVALVVPGVLAAVPRTRRFGLGMLLGTVSTAVVIVAVASVVLWLLVTTGA